MAAVQSTIWAVYETTDEYGRRGAFRGYFSTKEQAEAYARGKGWYGTDGLVEPEYIMEIDHAPGSYLLKKAAPVMIEIGIDPVVRKKMLRESGLAKLTEHEKQALGLRDR